MAPQVSIQGPGQRQQMSISNAAVAGRRSIPEHCFSHRHVLVGHVVLGDNGEQIKQALQNGEIGGPDMPDYPIGLVEGFLAGDEASPSRYQIQMCAGR